MLSVSRSTLSGLALLALVTGPAACGGAAPTESESVSTQASSLCPLPQGDGIHLQSCIVIPPPTPPPLPAPVAPAFPSIADVACPTGATCTYTPTEITAPSGIACSAPYWFTETGTVSAFYMVMYCTRGVGAYVDSIPNWIAESPTFQAAETTTQPGLPTAAAADAYVQFLPPIPALNGFPYLSTYPAGELTQSTVPSYGAVRFTELPCTDLYSSTTLAQPTGSLYVSPRVMLCVPSLNLLTWVDDFSGTDGCSERSDSCASAWVASGSDIGLLAAPFGYVYVTYASAGGPVGGGCETGCGGPHY
jgi:hypothetical protein